LDSDDKWDKNSFNYAFLFFKFHKKIDIIIYSNIKNVQERTAQI